MIYIPLLYLFIDSKEISTEGCHIIKKNNYIYFNLKTKTFTLVGKYFIFYNSYLYYLNKQKLLRDSIQKT